VKLPVDVVRTTVDPGVAVPLTVLVAAGCVVLVAGDRIAMVGEPITVKLFTAGTDGPPVLLAKAVTLCTPAANVRLEQA
jgi:hypothetical protein